MLSRKEFRQAHALTNDGHFAEALELLSGPWNDPADAAQADRLAVSALAGLGRLDDALSASERVLAVTPDDLDLLGFRLDALLLKERFTGARESAERILATEPDQVDAWRGLADAAFGLGDDEAGYEALKEALRRPPLSDGERRTARKRGTLRTARILRGVADLLADNGYPDCMAYYDLSCEVADACVDISADERVALHFDRASGYGRYGRWLEAAGHLQQLAGEALAPVLRVDILSHLGNAFARAYFFDRAELTFLEALPIADALGSENEGLEVGLRVQLAEAQLKQGRTDEAETSLADARSRLERDPDAAWNRIHLKIVEGELRRAQNRLAEAEQAFATAAEAWAAELGPEESGVMRCLIELARVQRDRGRTGLALANARRAREGLEDRGHPYLLADADELVRELSES